MAATEDTPLVTIDLFSALLDSRAGATAALTQLAAEHGWPGAIAGDVYDQWDRRNKQLHAACTAWVPFRELAVQAMTATMQDLQLSGDPRTVTNALLASAGSWPLWPDVAEGLAALGAVASLGVLSNVDDDIYARTVVAQRLGTGNALTSQKLQAYKPHAAIYTAARAHARGPYVHVASSQRDVRGAAAAGIHTVRLVRSGFDVDEDGARLAGRVEQLADVTGFVPPQD